MSYPVRIFSLLFLTLSMASAFAVDAAERSPKVLIIGIDGCRPDALRKAKTPNLDALVQAGTLFEGTDIRKPEGTDQADTISGPGWSNLLTGVWPDKHQVLNNEFSKPNYKLYPHMFARLKEVRPDAVTASFSTWPPIEAKIVTAANVSRNFSEPPKDYARWDVEAASACAEYLTTDDPDLVVCYQGQVDGAGHAHGFHPSVSQYISAIETVDNNVGKLIAAIQSRPHVAEEDWLTIVCTDHGGQGTGHGNGHAVPEIRTTFLIVSGSGAKQGQSETPTFQVDVAPTALSHLNVELPPSWGLDGRVVGLKEKAKQASRPNILFIFSDDHAEHAISAYGSKVNQTPHLDRLANEGARFTNSFVTNSICTPSRATLLTGQYSHQNGVPVFNRFDESRDTVVKHLHAGGYHTGMIGKWHLGSDPTGFDRWIVLPGQGAYWDPVFIVPGNKIQIEGHCTDITTDLGIEFLKTRPKDKPFFLMLHQKAPHRAWEPDERNKAKFKDQVIPEPATLWDDYATRPAALPENEQTVARDLTRRDLKLQPPDDLTGQQRNQWLNVKPKELTVSGKVLEGDELTKWKYQRYMQDYLACVQGVDDGVGRVLDYLDEADLAEETIIIYSADNGWYLGDLGLYDKRFMYEPGLRVPLIARGPGIQSGSTPSQFVANIDLAPTFLDLAGLQIPDFMQGRSIAPLLRGESPKDWRNSVYYRYYHAPGHHNTQAHYGVRTKSHKLIYYWAKDVYEMFDIKNDPTEQHNLLFSEDDTRNPEIIAKFEELKAEISRLQKQFRDDGKYADPATWPKGSSDGPFNQQPLGRKSVAEAIKLSQQ